MKFSKFFGVLLLVTAVAGVIVNFSDIRRYMRIRTM
jgi:hypothetical protein